jgi:chromosome segregation protein
MEERFAGLLKDSPADKWGPILKKYESAAREYGFYDKYAEVAQKAAQHAERAGQAKLGAKEALDAAQKRGKDLVKTAESAGVAAVKQAKEAAAAGAKEAAGAGSQVVGAAKEKAAGVLGVAKERASDVERKVSDSVLSRFPGAGDRPLTGRDAKVAIEFALNGPRAVRDLGDLVKMSKGKPEQLKALQQSFKDWLIREKTDLDDAIRALRTGIASLNREGRERLLTAFEQVNENFRLLFTHLFGGGEARLVLIESDDPLEAGLEIMCQPPGKKLSVLSLLSGGEQTLTALALIFAVFLANPAPICVLDEVDAPLDDANVARFCDLLDEMARRTETRFLIITHHAVTMARMDRLFGVTMQEQGVSRIVAVDMESALSMAEAA